MFWLLVLAGVGAAWLAHLWLQARERAADSEQEYEEARDRDEWRLEAGGSPETAIAVATPSVIEPRAESLGCASCGAQTRVREHRVVRHAGARFRAVAVECSSCGLVRDVYFRLAAGGGEPAQA